jgi:LPXTG-motif cell wall-anchored protein
VKAFATSYLPKAQSHLDMSQAVLTALNSTAGATDGLPRTGSSSGGLVGLGVAALLLGLATLRLSRRSAAAQS